MPHYSSKIIIGEMVIANYKFNPIVIIYKKVQKLNISVKPESSAAYADILANNNCT